MVRVAYVVVLLGLLAVPAAAAPSGDLVIVASGKFDQRHLGPYFYGRELNRSRSYPAAVAAFGAPSSRGTDVPGSNLCTVRWRRVGLDIGFASEPGACRPRILKRGAWYGSSVHSRRWVTARGLRVGDSVQRLRALYPKARSYDRPPAEPYWSLVREAGEFGTVHALTAVVWDGRIVSFEIPANYVY
jgi:hypothetical protein